MAKVGENHKYCNNYDYNRSIYLIGQQKFLENNFFIIKESEELNSPVSVLFYETYKNEQELQNKINPLKDRLQCIAADDAWYTGSLNFGELQKPKISDYADNVDTIEFLIGL